MKLLLKSFAITILGIFALLTLFLAFLPTFFSSDFGKTVVLDRISKNTNGKITAEKLNLSWLGAQSIENIRMQDNNGDDIFSADLIKADFSPFTFLFGNSIKKLSLQNVHALIAADSAGNTNFERSYNPLESNDPIYLNNVNLELFNNGSEFLLKGFGDTLQQDLQGTFEIEAEAGKTKKIQLFANNFPVLFIDQFAAIRYKQPKGLFLAILGNKINEISILTSDSNVALDASSPTFNAHLKGTIKKDTLFLNSKSTISFELSQENVVELQTLYALSFLGNPHNNLVANLAVKDLSIPLTKKNISELEGAAILNLKPISFDKIQLANVNTSTIFLTKDPSFTTIIIAEGETNQKPFSLNVDLAFNKEMITSPSKNLSMGAKGNLIVDNKSFSIKGKKENGKLALSIIPEEKDSPNFELQVFQSEKNFFPLTGKTKITNLPEGFFSIYEILIPFKATSDRLDFDLKAFSKERKNLVEGSGYASHFSELEQLDAGIKFNLAEADFFNAKQFYSGNIQAKLTHNQFNANISLIGSKQALIKSIEGSILGDLQSEEIAFRFKADESLLTGALHHHEWDFYPLTLGGEGQLQKFPIAILCPLLDANLCKKSSAIFGPLLDGNAKIQINDGNGPISLSINGTNGFFQLNGNVKDDILYLNEPLKAQANASAEFKEEFLKGLLPFIVPVLEAKKPIIAEISPNSFSLPLKNFSIEQMNIGKGTIELPEMISGATSQLSKATQLIGINQNIDLAFTPLYFSLTNGVLKLQRMDILVNGTYPLASWGNIDFVNDKLKLTVGISEKALTSALPLKDLKIEMLQIPISGTIAHPNLDLKSAAARISTLIAQQKGGTEIKILGSVLEVVSGMKNEKVPKPTTNPLPW